MQQTQPESRSRSINRISPYRPKMKKKATLLSTIVALTLLAVSPARANITIVFTSVGCELGLTSTGQGIDNTFVFSLGTFDSGFTPTSTNLSQWTSHWNNIADGGYGNDTGDSGIANTGFFAVEYVGTYAGSGASTGQQAYIWGYNPAKTEMILLSNNTAWILPDPTTLPPINWLRSTYDAGTYAVLGTLNPTSGGVEPYLETAAVPEPSTLAVLAIGAISVFGVWRMRTSRTERQNQSSCLIGE